MEDVKWTQEEAIALECARDSIGELISIYSYEVSCEDAKLNPDRDRIMKIEREISRLAKERASVSIFEKSRIALIRKECSDKIKKLRKSGILKS